MRLTRWDVKIEPRVNPTVKGNLIRLSKLQERYCSALLQVLFFFQIMPYGGFYIGLLSLVLDLSIYCWVASGAHKSVTAPRSRDKSTARLGVDAGHPRTLLFDQDL